MKHSKFFAKVLALFCVCAMLLSALPLSAFASEEEVSTASFVSETHEVFKTTESTIAPGITQSINYAYAKDGKQMVYYVATADINRDDVVVQTSYYKQHEGNALGMQKLSEQMAYAKDKYSNPDDANFISQYYTPVVGVNASFYNMTTGQPTGIAYVDGVAFGTAAYDNFFAILKDGTAVIDYRTNEKNYTGDKAIMHAVAGSQWLVRDGKDVTANISGSYNTDRHSRTCVGITADGKVVFMVLDGRQEPFSCGGTMHELAQIMLEQNCVAAVNLDGGGSTTFAARQEGENNVSIVNRPSDGSERSISAGLMISSLAAPSDVFDRASLTAESEYVTPGSVVNVEATGVSPAGTAAVIPENAVWQLEDASMGTVTDGVFTASDKTGVAVIQLTVDGKVVGETSVNVVIPDALKFGSEVITVPYSKTVKLALTATYGLNEVTIKPEDISFSLTNTAVGSFDDFYFTACEEDETITGSDVTATLNLNNAVTATAAIALGKGSEVVADFESGTLPETYEIKTGYPQYGPNANANGQNEIGRIYTVDAETGKVHDGNYAMAVECDFSQAYETGYHLLNLTGLNIFAPAKAQTIGMWIYIPELEELYTTSMRLVGTTTSGSTVNSPWLWDNCIPYGWDNDGWRYISMDISGYKEDITFKTIQFYICDRDNTNVNFVFKDNASVNGKFTYYIDNVTLDYSSAVDDREPPVFASVRYADESMSDAVELKGQSVAYNTISFGAVVHENTNKDNYTGIDASSAKAFIDGVAVDFTYAGGIISIADAVLADGVHTIRFEIADMMGNVAYAERQITINSGSSIPTVAIVPQNPAADKILIGSLYWVNLETASAKDVETATVTFNLNSMSQWELDHMVPAPGFKAEYTYDEVNNNATITVTKIGEVADDETVLVEIPIRTWESRLTEYEYYEDQTPEKLWARKIIWPIDIKLSANYGAVEFTDGTKGSFSMAPIAVITELYGNYGEMNANGDYANKKSWHIHTAEAMDDKAATCTEAGYTGRTFCAVCNSVVDWGTVVAATGHDYKVIDGVLKCECGKLFNGEQDGVLYVDGIAAQGWIADSYYVDGVKLTGIQVIDGFYYDFGDDGICAGQSKFTGLFFDGEVWRYAQLGELSAGWKLIDNEWYYFRESTKAAPQKGYKYWDGTPYEFEENGKLISGVWVTTEEGTRYYYAGSSYYRTVNTASVAFYEIDGKTYGFDRNGYIYKDGVYGLGESNQKELVYYEFDADGVRTAIIDFKNYSGIIKTASGSMHYYVNGTPRQMGLIKIGDYFYYIRSGGVVATGSYNCTYNMTNEIPIGVYEFDANGRMLNVPEVKPEEPEEPTVKNGIVNENGTLYYYINDVKQVNLGLIEIEDNGEKCFIYVRTAGQLAVGKYKVWLDNGYVPYASEQDFGTDGKMKNAPKPDVKDGIVNEGGTLYYYIDGVKQVNLGLTIVEIDGERFFIYVRTAGQLAVGKYKVWLDNGYVPYASEQDFGTDGKMKNVEVPGVKNGIVKEGNTLYYYVNGEKQVNLGLIKIDVDGVKHFIYVRTAGQLAVGTYKVWLDNGYVPYASEQVFDANTGYMVTD